jgi:transposase
MPNTAEPLRIRPSDRELLDSLVRTGRTAQRIALRARILLGAADGESNSGLARRLGVTRVTVLHWRAKYETDGVQAVLKDPPRGGGMNRTSETKVDAIVHATLHTTPKDATHWSSRAMARAQNVSQSMVVRIWQAHGLQPHRIETFKLSKDPEFAQKVRDVVGLYLNPPDKALVLCVDEKSQIQALDRTQPALPMRPGNVERHTHDYVRHGTTTLFAALNILDGTVIGRCQPRHTHEEFLTFLEQIQSAVPHRREVHLVLDNYGTHKHPAVRAWFAKHPRFHVHFVPTSSSWLNLVERWFAEITRKRIRRGTFKNVPSLVKAIRDYIRENNREPKPFIWTAPASRILRKVARCKANAASGH